MIMRLIKFLHWLFGHNWVYGDYKGMQSQPTTRVCKGCHRLERWYGHMGYTGWYNKQYWRTDKEQNEKRKRDDEDYQFFEAHNK